MTKLSAIGTFSHATEVPLFGLVCSTTYTAFSISLAVLAIVFDVIDLLIVIMRLICHACSILLLFSNRSTNTSLTLILDVHKQFL